MKRVGSVLNRHQRWTVEWAQIYKQKLGGKCGFIDLNIPRRAAKRYSKKKIMLEIGIYCLLGEFGSFILFGRVGVGDWMRSGNEFWKD